MVEPAFAAPPTPPPPLRGLPVSELVGEFRSGDPMGWLASAAGLAFGADLRISRPVVVAPLRGDGELEPPPPPTVRRAPRTPGGAVTLAARVVALGELVLGEPVRLAAGPLDVAGLAASAPAMTVVAAVVA
eukprot:CAMPEP_0206460112 /NCGR_PEP_ID=MMETSP0324_2-20121206/24574_1 /ASSEMBLY_ACC=CAM_ASM_000836 /TAXON_ID=2866 /ORGANISM="Crypthecodinium cohnii, Strain Seligo" /LENGTH=130 /DNA_ID=CAMNT_0053931785 /DNA_START=184 /DNA_END=574 /DNA_ORIENTATION=-